MSLASRPSDPLPRPRPRRRAELEAIARETTPPRPLLATCLARLDGRPDDELRALFVPGRIELLGKHTDYCGGRSLIAAASRGFLVVSTPCDERRLELLDARTGEQREVDVAASAEAPRGDWANYAATAARRLARDFPELRRGARVAFWSDLPPAAGMSSSSALLIASALTLIAWNDLAESSAWREAIDGRLGLASYLAAVESGASFGPFAGDAGVGTHGGSEDHTAILCSVDGTVAQWSFVPPHLERRVPLARDLVLTIASSGVAAEKTGAALARYNRAAALARAAHELAARELGVATPSLAALLESSADAAVRARAVLEGARHRDFTSAELVERLDHFVEESTVIVPQAADALARGDLRELGACVDRSQDLGARLLSNQTPETCHLAASARELGAHAASAFGAGFGGSVWALTRRDEAARLLRRWREGYVARFPQREIAASFFTSEAAPAAAEL